MATIEKFTFGEDFDAPEPTLPEVPVDEAFVEEEIIPVPTFSEEEMAQARAEGLAQGRAEAEAAALASIEQRISEALAAIRSQLDRFGETVTAAMQQREQAAVALAATLARKTLPEIARNGAVEALSAFVADCMERVREEPRLVIRVNEEVVEPLRGRMADIAAENGYPGDIAVISDADLPPTDCHIEWGEGGTDYRQGRIWSEIDDLVQSFLDSYARPSVSPEAPDTDDSAPQDEIS